MEKPYLQVIECLFENTWNLLVGFKYPGIGISAAAILLGYFMIILSIKIIRRILGGDK